MKINGYTVKYISEKLVKKLINDNYTNTTKKDKYDKEIIYLEFEDGETFTVE